MCDDLVSLMFAGLRLLVLDSSRAEFDSKVDAFGVGGLQTGFARCPAHTFLFIRSFQVVCSLVSFLVVSAWHVIN